MNGQPTKHSFLESLVNVAIGFVINFAAQLLIFPAFGWHIPLSSNFAISLTFTAISIVRSFTLRRLFNWWR